MKNLIILKYTVYSTMYIHTQTAAQYGLFLDIILYCYDRKKTKQRIKNTMFFKHVYM
jgi:hypothetical protein